MRLTKKGLVNLELLKRKSKFNAQLRSTSIKIRKRQNIFLHTYMVVGYVWRPLCAININTAIVGACHLFLNPHHIIIDLKNICSNLIPLAKKNNLYV
jgi:hypothetical protein